MLEFWPQKGICRNGFQARGISSRDDPYCLFVHRFRFFTGEITGANNAHDGKSSHYRDQKCAERDPPFRGTLCAVPLFEEKLADVLDERMEGFEKLQKELSAFADAVLVPDRSKLSAKQRLALYMSHDFQAATAIAGLDLKMRAERKLYVDEQNFDPVLAADRISTPPKSVRFARIEGSDDLGATLLTELLEMVEQGIELKKCEYCHRYFIPFSSKALYCDRSVGDTGKAAKNSQSKRSMKRKSLPMMA